MVAYHSGKAAKVAPPAVSNQTSLPSQCGPMALSITRRLASSRPRKGSSMPTPKSKPSRKKNPIQRTAIKTNQSVLRSNMIFLLILGADQNRLTNETPVGGVGAFPGKTAEQIDICNDQPNVEQEKANQREQDHAGRQVRGDGILRL